MESPAASSVATRSGRSPGSVAASATGVLVALALAACAPAASRQSAGAAAVDPAASAPQDPAATLENRRELPGAGAVAFDATARRLAWASGNDVRILDLQSGEQDSLAAAAWVSDLGFAPDGSLWVVAGGPSRWRAGEPACRAQGVEADRLLALDAQGAVVAGYSHSDGVGMLRRQVWLDERCAVAAESTQPLPPGVDDADADRGEPLRRKSLQAPRWVPPSPLHPPGAAQARAVAVSGDRRWWIFDEAGNRSLWEAVPRR